MKPVNIGFALILFVLIAPLNFSHAENKELNEKNGELSEEVVSEVAADKNRALTEIVITADPRSPGLLEYGSPVTVLDRKEILQKAQTTLGETIGNEPGVSSSYFGPGASRPVIRGNSGERIRVLKNGVGTLDVSNTSEDHNVGTNPLSAESIEILRGPETLLYGNSAIGGVVNVTENSIPENEIGKPLTGAIDSRLGTADDDRTGAVKLEGQAGQFNWHLDYFHQDTDDLDIPSFAESSALRASEAAEHVEEGQDEGEFEEIKGRLPNSATRSGGYTIGTSYIWGEGFVGASFNSFESKYGIPGHAHEEQQDHEIEDILSHDEDEHGEEAGVAIDLDQKRIDVRGAVNQVGSSIESVKFKLGVSKYQHKELEDGGVGTKFDNDALEARLEIAHAPIGSFEGVIGGQLQASEFSAVGEESFLPATDTISPAVFIFEEFRLNDFLKLESGGRVEHISYQARGFTDDSYTPLGVSTGIVVDPTGDDDYTVGLSLAFTQRAPAATELYANGAHAARQLFEVGDTSLELEESVGVDLTFKKNTGLITGAVNLFAQEYNNYINLSQTGGEEDGLPVFSYESIDAKFVGFEAEATVHLHKALDLLIHDLNLNFQVDTVRAKNRSDDEDLPRIPPVRTIVGVDYQYKNRFGASVEGVFVEDQGRTAEFESPTGGYQLLNSSLDIKIPTSPSYQLALYLQGTNLTDQEARVHSSFIKDLAPLRGRNFLLGVRGTF